MSRARALALFALTGLFPCAILGTAVSNFVFNHFYALGPGLLDAGWYSAIVYRSGFVQTNPTIACCYATTYYGVHVSPFTSFLSLISYLVPVERIEWYAITQALVFAPLALATHLVSSRVEPEQALRRAGMTIVASLAFVFSQQVLLCIIHPHYEAAIPGFICLLLASIVTGRRALVWPLFALAVSVREDAGFHTALLLTPLLYLAWKGIKLPLSTRRLLTLFCAGAGASVTAMAIQKLHFHSVDLFRKEYLGELPLHHLSLRVVLQRLRFVALDCPFIMAPFAGSVAIAWARRDGRFLLGWAAATPWFAVNLLAAQEDKAVFSAYIGFPFLVSLFWVYLYGGLLAPVGRRLPARWLEGMFAVVAASSTVATLVREPGWYYRIRDDLATLRPADRAASRAFAAAIRAQKGELGRLYVDDSVASFTLESLTLENSYGFNYQPGITPFDTVAFHWDRGDARFLADAAAAGIERCRHVIGTGFFFCRHPSVVPVDLRGVPLEEVPPLLTLAWIDYAGRQINVLPAGVTVHKASATGLIVHGLPMRLDGSYETVWEIALDDVDVGSKELVRVAVVHRDLVIADGVIAADGSTGRRLTLPFTAERAEPVEIRLWYLGGATFTIRSAQLRRAVPR